jgi:hypothetical protein
MTDSLLDDVKALLDKDFGDDRILKQIFRACENNEVISNYERNYVRKLAEKYLGKRPEIVQTQIPVIEKPVVPDVILSEIPSVLKPQILQSTSPRISPSKSKNSKIMLGVGSIALVIIIASVVSFANISDISKTIETPTISNSITLSIQTDLSSYNKKDLISISGISDTSRTVNLSIENQSNELVWAEQVSIKNNGRYSTLAIAGGPGWETSGTYTIKVDNGVDTKSNTFSFTV